MLQQVYSVFCAPHNNGAQINFGNDFISPIRSSSSILIRILKCSAQFRNNVIDCFMFLFLLIRMFEWFCVCVVFVYKVHWSIIRCCLYCYDSTRCFELLSTIVKSKSMPLDALIQWRFEANVPYVLFVFFLICVRFIRMGLILNSIY